MKEQEFEKIWEAAVDAGIAAGHAAIPTPMIVGTATTVFGNEIDSSKPVYYVPEGPCGFAEVTFKGNTSFGRWASKTGRAKKNSYYGGLYVWISEYGQSVIRKEAYAQAFASVLRENGIEAYASSRLD